MQDGIKYWVVFVEGLNDKGKTELFPVTYIGRKIIWDYLMDVVIEQFNLHKVHFNGYQELTKTEYEKLHLENI